ncbi:hypothetical protein ACOMHN_054134 [Nucella lapillus]
MFQAADYMQGKSILHADIKADISLLAPPADPNTLRLGDFRLARYMTPSQAPIVSEGWVFHDPKPSSHNGGLRPVGQIAPEGRQSRDVGEELLQQGKPLQGLAMDVLHRLQEVVHVDVS